MALVTFCNTNVIIENMVSDLIFGDFSGILKGMTNILKPHDLYLKLDTFIHGNGVNDTEAVMVLDKWDKIRFAETSAPAIKKLRSYINSTMPDAYAERLIDIIDVHVNECLMSTFVDYAKSLREQAGVPEPESETPDE